MPEPAPAIPDVIGLTAAPLDAGFLLAALGDESAGGICVFLGTTRSETGPQGQTLLALDYEAYDDMARRQLEDLARTARSRWPVARLVLVHRTGRVALGEASVIVGVSTPHRGEAFECCRWLIDTLKAELAVWKKEVWDEGEATWSRPNREWKGGAS